MTYIDRGLRWSAAVFITLAIAFMGLALARLFFFGHEIARSQRDEWIAVVWVFLAVLAGGILRTRRHLGAKANNSLDSLGIPVWSIAWIVACLAFVVVLGFTRLGHSPGFGTCALVIMLSGAIVIGVHQHRWRIASGRPLPKRQKAVLALVIIATVINIMQLLWLWLR